jgi:predicted permease
MAAWLRVLAAKLRDLWHGRSIDRELSEEMLLHRELLTERFLQQGMSLEDASAAAQRQYGNSTLLQQRHYEERPFLTLTTLWRDLRFGARQLRRNPLLTGIAITSLALGIGANTAIFTAAKRVLFDTLPVAQPHQLRLLTWTSGPEQIVPPVWGDVWSPESGGLESDSFSYPVLEELRKRTDAFQDLIAFKDVAMTATADGHPEVVVGEMISGDAFRALGVAPIIGRTLTAADDVEGGNPPVAVISGGYWALRFGRSPSVLGKSISLNGVPVTVVGVMDARFDGLQMGTAARIFLPLTLQPLVIPRAQNGSVSLLDNPQSWWVQILARLRPDIPEKRAEAEMDVAMRQAALPSLSSTKDIDKFHLKLEPGDRGEDDLKGAFARPSYVLLALAALVLLLACVNLANLLLARAATRQREMSTRLALGASRWSILRQMLTESLLLSVLGGVVGLLLGWLGRNLVPHLLRDAAGPDSFRIDFDWRVVLFTFGISLATGLLFGLAPAWQATRAGADTGLRDSGHATANRHRLGLDKGLVVLQIALSAILLMGAGLFARTLGNLSHIPLGFQADHLLLFRLNPPSARYTDAQGAALYRQLEQKLAAIPGVRSVSMSNIAIIGDGHSGAIFKVSGRPAEQKPVRVQANGVSVDFFRTMGIPILQGRAFSVHDTPSSPRVAVINRALARKFFPNENPVGRIFETDPEDVEGPVEIVGVAADTRYADLRSETPPTFYASNGQKLRAGRMVIELRTAAEPGSVLAQARTAVESLDRDLPLMDVRTMTEQINTTLTGERTFAQLTAGFSVLALILATIGIYGIMAYTVSRRTSEIGLRIALGAPANLVLGRVLREALVMTVAGIFIGVAVAVWLTRFFSSMLYGLKAADPITLAGTALVLAVIAIVAAFAPARRASRIDPIRALRHE